MTGLYRNVTDVENQLRAAGLLLETVTKANGGTPIGGIYVESTKSVRCDVSGIKQKKTGAYRLHELRLGDGIWITGAYWTGHGNAYNTIELNKACEACGHEMPLKEKKCPACGKTKFIKRELSPEQLEAHKARMAELRRQAEAEAKANADRAARWAQAVWRKCRPAQVQDHDYLTRKGLTSAHGARIFEGNDGIQLDGAEPDDYKYLARLTGALVIPMCDGTGQSRGLQFILSREKHKDLIARRDGKDKTYWPEGMANDGLYTLIGQGIGKICCIAEGFATGASIHEATGLPIAIAYDAGGLGKVGGAIWTAHKKRVNLLYCADDDWLQKCESCGQITQVESPTCQHCGNPHGKSNAGLTKAREAALATNGAWIAPAFADRPTDKKGPTDFNDLAIAEGNNPVRAQIENKLAELEWITPAARPRPAPAAAGGQQGGAGEVRLSMLGPDDVAGRFSPVWSPDDVYYFDHIERVIVTRASITGRMNRHGWDLVVGTPEWQQKPEVAMEQVDFDPAETDPDVTYNLWGGWPVIHRQEGASCQAILALLRHLVSHEGGEKEQELFDWVIKWLAYPLQNIGAKMQTCILMHGGQGAGKNTVFNNLLDVYSTEYAVEFGPKQLEKRFNAIFSKRMFAIGNEIVASRDDLYHVKGQIKHMITEKRWIVEAKNKDERWERNCCNFIFLSNELKPAAIETGDRRHCVIWTPPVPEPGEHDYDDYKARVGAANDERKNGGSAALYDYLMSVDLTGFHESTWPPMTEAKAALIEDNLDSRQRFWELWKKEEIGGLPHVPCLSEDLYDAYRHWTGKAGIGKAVALHSLIAFVRKQRGVTVAQEYYLASSGKERRMCVIPYNAGPPAFTTKPKWLGETIAEFKDALGKYKDDR